ncbi:hypothetical protein [Oscillatoria salina]|uniref:hypothetical protein n=1 Tax=Oscillatoria salina TaxID=331517 RepID=UPI0013B65AA9|nr:hypothetical protein [Oscillatoria salina]MBZ8181727.1 hypothetical protein [Oscillatoria salina IIICB1]NET90353.1 hypothetical protein [Kamptonema sp. SIO1D9]
MALISSQCYDCKQLIKFEVQQTIINQKLRWYLSGNCHLCGSSIELDDVGFLPENLRQKILKEEGEWKIIIKNYAQNKSVIIKCFRQILNISTVEAYRKIQETVNNHDFIYRGTKVEIEWLLSYFQLEKINCIVQRIEAS